MDVKIFQSKNLGFVVCEVDNDCACDDTYCVTNPRMLQMFIAPDEAGGKNRLQVQLLPMVYKEVLVDATFETSLAKRDYTDVTEKFAPSVIDMYIKIEGRLPLPVKEEEDNNVVDLFSK